MSKTDEYWDLWYPEAGATGISLARGLLAETDRLIVHAPAPVLTAEVRSTDGDRIAFGKDLEQTEDRPMAVLVKHGEKISREDRWLNDDDLGTPVILPGGEVGILTEWWNADDGDEWLWKVEFRNSR